MISPYYPRCGSWGRGKRPMRLTIIQGLICGAGLIGPCMGPFEKVQALVRQAQRNSERRAANPTGKGYRSRATQKPSPRQ
jgi:hypothetical protein